jgi:phage-related protein
VDHFLAGKLDHFLSVANNAFVKKTQKTPRSAMNLALKRLKELGL